MKTDKSEENIILDPAGMNIVNRIAPGTRFVGTLECNGGLIVQGEIDGDVSIQGGPLVLMQGGVITGDMTCGEDAYLFGTIRAKKDGEHSELVAEGAVFMTESLDAKMNVSAGAIKTYEGAQFDGRIRTLRKTKNK